MEDYHCWLLSARNVFFCCLDYPVLTMSTSSQFKATLRPSGRAHRHIPQYDAIANDRFHLKGLQERQQYLEALTGIQFTQHLVQDLYFVLTLPRHVFEEFATAVKTEFLQL